MSAKIISKMGKNTELREIRKVQDEIKEKLIDLTKDVSEIKNTLSDFIAKTA